MRGLSVHAPVCLSEPVLFLVLVLFDSIPPTTVAHIECTVMLAARVSFA